MYWNYKHSPNWRNLNLRNQWITLNLLILGIFHLQIFRSAIFPAGKQSWEKNKIKQRHTSCLFVFEVNFLAKRSLFIPELSGNRFPLWHKTKIRELNEKIANKNGFNEKTEIFLSINLLRLLWFFVFSRKANALCPPSFFCRCTLFSI